MQLSLAARLTGFPVSLTSLSDKSLTDTQHVLHSLGEFVSPLRQIYLGSKAVHDEGKLITALVSALLILNPFAGNGTRLVYVVYCRQPERGIGRLILMRF